MKVFVSYSHRQGEWVLDALVPVLRASGCDILVDWGTVRQEPCSSRDGLTKDSIRRNPPVKAALHGRWSSRGSPLRLV
jgi:hypothetical protein